MSDDIDQTPAAEVEAIEECRGCSEPLPVSALTRGLCADCVETGID